MMRRALAAAARGQGLTHPNPSVGAVVYRGDRVLAVGTTRPPGGAHAEIVAMDRARRRFGSAVLRGASLAVTLEPCSFTGRTGPCTEAILASGIARVVAGCRDPHHRVAGRGFARLRRAGVEVVAGVLEAECREMHRGFLSVCERGRPFVTLKLATSLDGRIATARGESRWITSPTSRARVHRLRRRVDAVLVGSGTALADDPELTVRRGDRVVRTPVRVLIDGRLRVPASARLFVGGAERRDDSSAAGAPHPPRAGASASRAARSGETWVVCGRAARGRPAARRRVDRLIEVDCDRAGHVDLRAALPALAEAGLTSILVEGGGELAAALLRADLVDEVHWFLAPRLIGSEGRAALGALGLERLADARSFAGWRVDRSGPDLHVSGRLAPAPREPRAGRRSSDCRDSVGPGRSHESEARKSATRKPAKSGARRPQ
ncbi:MAG: bifunctional diaminohydroxyphosphoribosylaminopyrimidine deaminase/5-amino-6-(5-phosphoribosylamino)uracil reductase RibD [Myxococcota bacterium]